MGKYEATQASILQLEHLLKDFVRHMDGATPMGTIMSRKKLKKIFPMAGDFAVAIATWIKMKWTTEL